MFWERRYIAKRIIADKNPRESAFVLSNQWCLGSMYLINCSNLSLKLIISVLSPQFILKHTPYIHQQSSQHIFPIAIGANAPEGVFFGIFN